MSKLLNLKGVKFFAIIVLAVAILATFGMVATTASAQQAVVSASDIQYAATVRSGSSGEAVIIWQKFFNGYSSANLVADGKFGPLTANEARTWQAARGLAADGVLGPLSRASAMAQIGAGVSMTYPAGCTSSSGYSTSTGAPCTGAPASGLPAGCTSTAGFSPTTGVRCDSGSTLPAGCTSTAGYSQTT
ncbi:MAG: peptidoglycan-binding domain-containing protein, partial [Candidatus Paceibacterota bacterium]